MNDLPHLLERASGYLSLGMFQDAWDELENLPPESRTHDPVLELKVIIYQNMGKWESARVLAESLAKRCPENPQWWILWAYSLRREKSIPEARAVLMEAASHHPDVGMIPYNLACYACVEGNIVTATALLMTAFTMEPELKKIALEDPDLDQIFGIQSQEPAPPFAPPHLPE